MHRTPDSRPSTLRLPAAIALCLAAGLAACASVPMPVEELAMARSAVANAVSAGGEEFAAGALQQARDKLARADAAAGQDKPDEARTLAQQAEADAQVAAARSRAAKAQRTLTALQGDNRVLQEEMERQSRAAPMPVAPTSPRN